MAGSALARPDRVHVVARRLILLVPLTVAASACSGNSLLPRLTLAPSPHDRYADALRSAALDSTALAQDWLTAADTALAQPLTVTLPMRESGYFAADRPSAVAYRVELQRGRRLELQLTFDSLETAQLFVDVFEVRVDAPPSRVASLTEGLTLNMDAPRDGTYLVRVQVELLRSGRYTIVQRALASLPFPVTGLDATAVQSEFGAARDAGRREHEGIDIFAPLNTPVVAVVDGSAQAGTNPLGGNVVWLGDQRQPRSFYYAHLTRAAFEGTSAVRAGDVVGYIGTTGNARGGAPHLHFGIYQRGAIDPLPFLEADDPIPKPNTATDLLGELARITRARATLRAGTPRAAPAIVELDRSALVRVAGVTGTQLRVELPDRSSGYLDRTAITVARTPLRRQRLAAGLVLREQPVATAPAVRTIDEPVAAEVIGEFGGFAFVRPSTGLPGWIAMKS
jgi:peptidoglycan LD-endopeptidase LytH